MSAYKNFNKYITHLNNIFSSNLCFTLSIKGRFRVVRDDSEYRSIKLNAINNHGGITRSTTSTHKGRRGNVRRTLNANANVRVFPVQSPKHPYLPIPETRRSDFALSRGQATLAILSSSGDNFSTHGITNCVKKIEEHFTPAAGTWVEAWRVEISTAWPWQIARLPTSELLAFSAAFTIRSYETMMKNHDNIHKFHNICLRRSATDN